MFCPKCGEMLFIHATKRPPYSERGIWFGRYECHKCRIFVQSSSSNKLELFKLLDEQLRNNQWFLMDRSIFTNN